MTLTHRGSPRTYDRRGTREICPLTTLRIVLSFATHGEHDASTAQWARWAQRMLDRARLDPYSVSYYDGVYAVLTSLPDRERLDAIQRLEPR